MTCLSLAYIYQGLNVYADLDTDFVVTPQEHFLVLLIGIDKQLYLPLCNFEATP